MDKLAIPGAILVGSAAIAAAIYFGSDARIFDRCYAAQFEHLTAKKAFEVRDIRANTNNSVVEKASIPAEATRLCLLYSSPRIRR
ncbi:hypothetical protein GGD81_004521 [Rhodobium orientis]|uniref:Uncharacterized protein n=1 Tax=Rhodobium orientis TaxID=34017 RepID=A0A327JGE7_9HYPH|nr:hypothetical protein [Rhodobium orientis]MBB4305444.1 hypothetical protein [Rhodobium orientis]RAI25480.1 hypothetical protein CH339_17840 [Rhodobium orientis]